MKLTKCNNCKCLTINKKLCSKCQKILIQGEKECLICDRTIPSTLINIRKKINYKNNEDNKLSYNPNEYGENINLCYYCNEEIKYTKWNNYLEKYISKNIIDNRNHYQYLKDKILNNNKTYADYNNYVEDINNEEFIKLFLIAKVNLDLGDETLIKKIPKDIKELKETIFNFKNYTNCIICNEPNNYYLCEKHLNEIEEIASLIKEHIRESLEMEILFNDLINVVLKTNAFDKNFNINLTKYILALEPLINDSSYKKTFYNENNFNYLKKAITVIEKFKLFKNDETIKKEEKKLNAKTNNLALDGHILQSDMEMRIDDILTNCNILHYIHKQVEEIYEENIISDFFIPIKNDKGIYIEYWGMETQNYITRKNKKIELYKKYNLPLIEIEKNEPLYDSQNFKSRLKKQLKNLAKKYYKCEMPEWI